MPQNVKNWERNEVDYCKSVRRLTLRELGGTVEKKSTRKRREEVESRTLRNYEISINIWM
jgi:hypothetical protein